MHIAHVFLAQFIELTLGRDNSNYLSDLKMNLEAGPRVSKDVALQCKLMSDEDAERFKPRQKAKRKDVQDMYDPYGAPIEVAPNRWIYRRDPNRPRPWDKFFTAGVNTNRHNGVYHDAGVCHYGYNDENGKYVETYVHYGRLGAMTRVNRRNGVPDTDPRHFWKVRISDDSDDDVPAPRVTL